MAEAEAEAEDEQPTKKRMKADSGLPIVWNVKVQHIRPNFRNLKQWCSAKDNVYIGRAGVVFIDGARFPPKQSIWANPYKIGKDGSRDEILVKYEAYLRGKLSEDAKLLTELRSLGRKNLGCWCVTAPTSNSESNLLCHGQIMIRLIKELCQ